MTRFIWIVGLLAGWTASGGCGPTLLTDTAARRTTDQHLGLTTPLEWFCGDHASPDARPGPGRRYVVLASRSEPEAKPGNQAADGTEASPNAPEMDVTEPDDGPLPDLWDTIERDLRQAPNQVWDDTKAVFGSGPNLVILGLTYGGSLALQETGPDDTIEDHFRSGHEAFGDDWRKALDIAGNPGTHFALAGLWYLIGQQSDHNKTYQVGKTLFSALAVNGLATMAGKAATWEDNPEGEWGAFPSGHTSSAFTFASVMHQAYGPWVGIPLYGLGGLVAYERLESNEHYFSDVIMGGVLGLVIGHTIGAEHELNILGGTIEPYINPESQTSGIAWVKHFK